jgi:NAD(P)-dependent dehydrogenase (short-subunit alcohol dehydrogenase family)
MTQSNPRRILITGANRGIGLATARELVRGGHSVTVTSRDVAAGQRAVDQLRAVNGNVDVCATVLDHGSFARVRQSATALAQLPPFDVVIHNAGILVAQPTRRLTVDGMEECLQSHALGPMLLTALLAPALPRPCRMITVGSSLHAPGTHGKEVGFDFADPNLERSYHPDRAYKNAKLAQLWFTLEFDRRFGGDGLRADAVCPGFIPETAVDRTIGLQRLLLKYVLPRMSFATSLSQAGKTLSQWALLELDSPGGRYFDGNQITAPSVEAQDLTKAREFWSLAERLIGHRLGSIA